MNEKKILYLTSFRTINIIPSSFGGIIKELNNSFNEFYLVNTDHLEINIKGKKYYKVKKSNFFKGIKLFNPRNFDQLENFIKGNSVLIINAFSRRIQYFRLSYFIARRKIPQIAIFHLGHVQPSDRQYRGKTIHRFRNFFVRTLSGANIPIKHHYLTG